MATYFRLLDPGRQFLDANGDPYSGGKLQTWAAGTTTDKTAYQDNAGAASHTNPIVLDSAGRVPSDVWGTTGAYKLRLRTPADVDVDTWDNIDGINDIAGNSASEWVASGLTPTFSDADTFTVAGNQTSVFHAGRRVKITDSGGTDYGFVTSSSYSDPTTTVNVVLDSGSIDSGISAVSYALISADNASVLNAGHCAFLVEKPGGQSIGDAAFTKIEYGTEAYDVGGNYDGATNYNFTAPVDGVYSFSAGCIVDDIAADKLVAIKIVCSSAGDFQGYGSYHSLGTVDIRAHIAITVKLDASETVHVEVWQGHGSARNLLAQADVNYFCGALLAGG